MFVPGVLNSAGWRKVPDYEFFPLHSCLHGLSLSSPFPVTLSVSGGERIGFSTAFKLQERYCIYLSTCKIWSVTIERQVTFRDAISD